MASSSNDLAVRHRGTGIAIVTTVGCPYCKKAKDALGRHNLHFDEIELTRDLELLRRIKETTKQSTVPQVFLGGQFIGGASELESIIEAGKLEDVLEERRGKPALPEDLARAVERSRAQEASVARQPSGSCTAEEYASLQAVAGRLRAKLLPSEADAAERSFTRSHALEVLEADEGSGTDGGAKKLLEKLLLAQILTIEHHADAQWSGQPEPHLRFVQGARQPRLGHPLNGYYEFYGPPRPASEVSEALRLRVLSLYDRHLSPDGRALDYKALSADPDFWSFVDATAELQKVRLEGLSREERMAFWINIYNILVVHALVRFGPAEGTLARLKWFASISYIVGGHQYSSNDIEHGVLRGNKPSPANILSLIGLSSLAPLTFRTGDPRMQQVIKPPDPRIHFALVCGAKSCPPIKVYTADALEEGLQSAAQGFVEGEVEVLPEERRLVMSKIFQWYGGDFGSKADLLAFLLAHLPERKRSSLRGMIDGVHDIRFDFKPYDWSQNVS